MGLTRCYKMKVFFTFIFAVFQSQSQSIAKILLVLLPHFKNKQMPYGNFTSGFDFYRASICEGGLGSRNSVRPPVRLSVCHARTL